MSGAISTGAGSVCSDFEHRAVVVEKLREEIARLYHMGDSPEVATSQKPQIAWRRVIAELDSREAVDR
jgi:hypothetical protein